MSDEDGRDRADRHGGPDRSSPYAVSRLSGPVSLVDSAREIERAEQWIATTSGAKLEQIAEQMRALRAQAERVLQEAQQNAELHRAEARFQRHPGKIYHLYERSPGHRYWSMLSPSDWGTRPPPHRHVGSFRLEGDQSWTPVERMRARDEASAPYRDWLAQGLRRGQSLSLPEGSDAFAREPVLQRTPEEEEAACESSSSPPSDPTGRV